MAESQHYHLAGVGGVGMSALAQALVDAGHRVSGSDRSADAGPPLKIFQQLEKAGVTIQAQDGSAITREVDALVVSTAIEEDNPELVAAKRLEIPVVHRSDVLAQLAEALSVVAIAGTSGKTTVTGMVGWLMEQTGQDPVVYNGGVVPAWDSPSHTGSVRSGSSRMGVVEVDESDRSLLRFRPDYAVLTNISEDHFSLDEVIALFTTFAGQVQRELLCGPSVLDLFDQPPHPSCFDPWSDVQLEPGGFTYMGESFKVPVPGQHNVTNAVLAVTACHRQGIPVADLVEPMSTFPGIHRRLEVVGRAGGVTVIDDYGHNPAKIEASWTAVAETAGRVVGVWRPHGFGPLASMADELVEVFRRRMGEGDRLYVLPVFFAGGTVTRTLESDAFVERLIGEGIRAGYIPDYPGLEKALLEEAREPCTILFMGARDPELPLFAKQMVGRLGEINDKR